MGLTVRKTTNLKLLQRLDAKLFGKDQDDIELKDHVWWIAVCDDKIAGFAGLKLEGDSGARFGYLAKAGVLKEFRGRGIQRELIRVRDAESNKRGYIMNITYTANWNHASANNLIREGYTLYSPQYRYGIRSALYFWKRFRPGDI
jgi:ribosomal protein S18 acetylase RimI-like enzyme